MPLKICCICSGKEAKLATANWASALGLVGNMPSGPGVISNFKIYNITNIVPSYSFKFFVDEQNKIIY